MLVEMFIDIKQIDQNLGMCCCVVCSLPYTHSLIHLYSQVWMCDEGRGREGKYSHLQKLLQVYMYQMDKLRKRKKWKEKVKQRAW